MSEKRPTLHLNFNSKPAIPAPAAVITNPPRTASLDGTPKPKGPHPSTHMREFALPDRRKLLIDRRAVSFLCEGKRDEFSGKAVTIVGFKVLGAKPCPIVADYAELKTWWSEGRM
jgi:hypothetical protein